VNERKKKKEFGRTTSTTWQSHAEDRGSRTDRDEKEIRIATSKIGKRKKRQKSAAVTPQHATGLIEENTAFLIIKDDSDFHTQLGKRKGKGGVERFPCRPPGGKINGKEKKNGGGGRRRFHESTERIKPSFI